MANRDGEIVADYDSSEYYEGNGQAGDRPALKFYYRLFKRQMRAKGAVPEKRERVLEYGSGVGHLTKRLCVDYAVYALDVSDYALSQVNKNAPGAQTIKTTAEIEDGSLDGVIALHVMEHIEKPEEVFDEFHKKLRPGGLLVFVVPNPDGWGHRIKKDKWFAFADKTHISLFGVARWLELTTASGFTITKSRGDGMWDTPYMPVVPDVLQKLFFLPPAAVQVLTGTAFLTPSLGECLIVVARK
jgi:SAM-dependent methyltransferase